MKKKKGQKVYRSIIEIEKNFFPISYKKKLVERRSKKPEIFGANLITELLEVSKQQLKQTK